MRDDRPVEADGEFGRAAFARLADRLARLPPSHPSAPGYGPGPADPGEGGAGRGSGRRHPAQPGSQLPPQPLPANGETRGRPGRDHELPGAGEEQRSRGRPWRRDAAPGSGEGKDEPRLSRGRPGSRGGPSLLDRFPPDRFQRLAGPGGKPARGPERPPGGLAPRPRREPYRPWFSEPADPWFSQPAEPGGPRPAAGDGDGPFSTGFRGRSS